VAVVTELKDSCLSSVTTHVCGTPMGNFNLESGRGYILTPSRDTVLDVVGSHDDEYKPGGLKYVPLRPCDGCPGPNLVSIPYHTRASSAEDICLELEAAGAPIHSVSDHVLDLDIFVEHPCGSAINDFALVPAWPMSLMRRTMSTGSPMFTEGRWSML